MKNNKGFTFVELLVVIALLSIVLILTISQVQRVNNNSKIKLCKNKLSLIEESLDLYLTNNRSIFNYKDDEIDSYICETPLNRVQGKGEDTSNCQTSIGKIAKLGIIEYDDEEKKEIINPVNKNNTDEKILNNYKVSITYDNITNKFSSRVLVYEENDYVPDPNYNVVCGKSDGINESSIDKSFFDSKEYNFYIKRSDNSNLIDKGKVKKTINEIGSYCKNLTFDNKDDYNYINYEVSDYNVYCNYKKIQLYSLNVAYDANVIITGYNSSTTYKPGESATINLSFKNGYQYNSFSCSPDNSSCVFDSSTNSIKVTFKDSDIDLNITSKKMLLVGMYYEDANYSYYNFDSSMYFKDENDAINYCQNNVKSFFEYYEFTFDEDASIDKRCNYKRKKVDIVFNLTDANITGAVINPGNSSISGMTLNSDYKYGQTVSMKINYATDYEYDSITCSEGATCKVESDGTITIVPLAEQVVILPKAKKVTPKYKAYYHYQDAEDINGYTSELIISDKNVDSSLTESSVLSSVCKTVDNYNYNSSISYLNASNNEVNCYYDRKTFNVTFIIGDKYVTGINVTPGSNTSLGNVDLTSGGTRTYRFGQEIIMGINGYSSDYKYKSVVCSDASKCNVGNGGKTKIIVPNNNNLVVTVNSQDIVKTFNVYYHYQDADDVNGYTVLKKYTTNISLPANYDSSDPDLTNRDLINSKKICESENVLTHFTYNNAISYLDRSKSEINCYFDRKLVSVTFDKSDSYITGVTVVPTNNNSVESTSITSTTTYKYRYGQEILMKINGYANDYMYKGISCSNSNLCTIGNAGTTKITATENLTIKPVSKPIEIPYKVYNHYQDADDGNGFTTKYINTVGIVLSTGDNANYSNICSSQSVEDYYTYNSALGYLDRSKKEINCYFERKEVSVTFDKSDSYVSGVTIVPTNSSTVGNTSLTATSTYKYRYGQEILMKINGYTTDYMYSGVTCSNSNLCTIGYAGMTKINAIQNLTIKPISKPFEVAYKLYNHYQDSNNVNGYTSEVKDISVVLSVGDANNVINFCSKEGKTGYTYYSAPSYMDRSKKEIDCYFNLN